MSTIIAMVHAKDCKALWLMLASSLKPCRSLMLVRRLTVEHS